MNKDNFQNINLNNLYIVSDFDLTLTNSNSDSTWGVFKYSDKARKEYIFECHEQYEKYHKYELDETVDIDERIKKVNTWFLEHISLFTKYNINNEYLENAFKNAKNFRLRSKCKELLDFTHEHNIPFIIVSAGIGNLIEMLLKKNNCYYENIYIYSNYFDFDNLESFDTTKIIHSLNKKRPDNIKCLENRENIILLGDQLSDLNMINEVDQKKAIKVCFFKCHDNKDIDTYKTKFDILYQNNDGYQELIDMLKSCTKSNNIKK